MTAAAAYDRAAGSWREGPDLVYDRLAAALLARGPAWRGLRVLDVGAGTGAATRCLVTAGAAAVPVDAAPAMLAAARAAGAPAVAADAAALPFRAGVADAAVLAFLLNHLADPAAALREAARVVRPGGWVLASTWAREDDHPVRHVVEAALAARGWRRPGWYADLKARTAPLTDRAPDLAAVAYGAGLAAVDVARVDVALPLGAAGAVAWRLGMPHTAPFVAGLAPADRAALRAELAAAAAGLPPLTCRTLALVARVP